MPYLPDLSPFTHSHKPKCGEFDVLSVGWLDGEHEYTKGEIDPEHWTKIKTILETSEPVNLTRGEHVCELCGQASGSGEYHAYNPRTGRIYIAPSLILHYIQTHQYVPPAEFVEGVLHKLLEEGDCFEIDGLYDALDFGMAEEIVREKVHKILGIKSSS
jgi:hypothetical protein